MVKKLKCKDLEKVNGGCILKCPFPISQGTAKDPLKFRNIVTYKGGYAVYDNENNYVKGFSTGDYAKDRCDAIMWAQDCGINTEEKDVSYFLSSLK